MKINSNLGANFEPQDFQKNVTGETAPKPLAQGDQLEPFDSSFGILQNADFSTRGPQIQDANFGAGLLFGARNESFGIQLAPAPETPADEEDQFSFRDILPPFSGWIGDGIDWLGDNMPSVQEMGEWLGDKVVDGFLYAGEGVADGIQYAGEGLADAAGAVAGAAEAVGGAVADAVGEVLDW
jgi:hypothetical protein